MVPSLSVLLAAENRTLRGAVPVAGVAVAKAVGGTPVEGVVVMVTGALDVLLPLLSVVRTTAPKVPTVLYT